MTLGVEQERRRAPRQSERTRLDPFVVIGGPGKRAAPSGPLSTCARRSRTMLADPRPHRRHGRPSCDRPALCHRFGASPGYGWRFRESARRRACAAVVAADLPSGRASASPSVSRIAYCRRRQRVMANRGGETVAWSVPYLSTCADGTPEPKCLNRRVELCQPGSNGLAGCYLWGSLIG